MARLTLSKNFLKIIFCFENPEIFVACQIDMQGKFLDFENKKLLSIQPECTKMQ